MNPAAVPGSTSGPAAAALRKPPLLAIVVPCFNEQECLLRTAQVLGAQLDAMAKGGLVAEESFLYFVDDGSTDASWSLLETIHREYPLVRALKLSRNFGHQNAVLAGLMAVAGRSDAAISIDADLQQDPGAIPEFVKQYLLGAEVVFGVRNDRASDGLRKRITALGFYRVMNVMGVNVLRNHADYRLLGPQALRALAEYPEPNIFLRAICAQLGFRTAIVRFDVVPRSKGESKYSFVMMLKLAIDGITSFSVVPLRLIAVVGALIFGGSMAMAGYILWRTLLIGDTVPGWASTALPIYFIGGIQLFCMGILGEYVAQVVSAVKRRPRYIRECELL